MSTEYPEPPTQRERIEAKANYRLYGEPVPVEFDNPRAKFASETLRRLEDLMTEADWANPAAPMKLQCELAQAHATLALAQEVANLRQMLEGVLTR